jgi:hypothetical protein
MVVEMFGVEALLGALKTERGGRDMILSGIFVTKRTENEPLR